MLDLLYRATCYHGVFPHFINGRSGATIPFRRKDDGGDLVETSFLCMGLLCARQYFNRDTPAGAARCAAASRGLWEDVEWNWYTQGGRELLYWHWSPNNGWAMDHEIRGWNECLITYVLAAGVAALCRSIPLVYHRGFAAGRDFRQRQVVLRHRVAAGHAVRRAAVLRSLLVLRPRSARPEGSLRRLLGAERAATCGSTVRTASPTPGNYKGYGAACWGLTASDDPDGYSAHAPDTDNGTISPTAALSSLPYAPQEVDAGAAAFPRRARRADLGARTDSSMPSASSATGTPTPSWPSTRGRSSS